MKDIFDWRQHVRKAREDLVSCDYDCGLRGLERAWQNISPSMEYFDREDLPADSLLGCYEYYVDIGCYPPPEILIAVADAYRLYLDAEGELTLDEIYFGRSVQKSGNYSARHARNIRDLQLDLVLRRAKDKGISQEKAAESFIRENNLDVDADTLIRSWHRRRKARKDK